MRPTQYSLTLPCLKQVGFKRSPRFLVSLMRYVWILSVAAMLLLSGCDDVTSSYDTVADARYDCLFERGWLPDILPRSTHNIRVTSNVDVNSADGEFSFDPADFPSFAAEFDSLYPPFNYRAGGYTWTFFCDA